MKVLILIFEILYFRRQILSAHKVFQSFVLDLALVFELNVAALHAFDKFIELFLHLSDQFLIVIDNFLKLRPI